MTTNESILFASFVGDAFSLGPHWIYSQREIAEKAGTISGYIDPLSSYHPGKKAGDFTHYGASFGYTPFKTDVRANIEKGDMAAIEKILAVDSNGFDEYCRKTNISICGRRSIRMLLTCVSSNGLRDG